MTDQFADKRYATADSLPFLKDLDALVVQNENTKKMVLMIVDQNIYKKGFIHCTVEAREMPENTPSAVSLVSSDTGKIIGKNHEWNVVFCRQDHELRSLKASGNYSKMFEYVAKNASKHATPKSLLADMAGIAFAPSARLTAIQNLPYRQIWEMQQRYNEIEQEYCGWSTPEGLGFNLLGRMAQWVFHQGADPAALTRQELAYLEEDARKLLPGVFAPKPAVTLKAAPSAP